MEKETDLSFVGRMTNFFPLKDPYAGFPEES